MVARAIASLTFDSREVITLFYMQEFSHERIAQFLGVPVTTVNGRLHSGRQRLKGRMFAMVKDVLKGQTLGDEFSERVGRIVQVRGSVIEAQFSTADVPSVLTSLTVTDQPCKVDLTIQVAQRLENGLVRCITTSAVEGLRPGMKVVNKFRPADASFVSAAAERLVRALSPAGPAKEEAVEIMETGIRVIDLLCPFVRGGRVGLFGPIGVGKLVLVEELVRRMAEKEGDLSLFTFVHAADAATVQQCYAKEPQYRGSGAGTVQNFFIPTESATDPENASSFSCLDAVVYLSTGVAAKGIYPAIDPLRSALRYLDSSVIGEERSAAATCVRKALHRARNLLASFPERENLTEEQRLVIVRAEKLATFFSQPFFVAEPYTHVSGRSVSTRETAIACCDILAGKFDDLPAEAFHFTGEIDDALEKAAQLDR